MGSPRAAKISRFEREHRRAQARFAAMASKKEAQKLRQAAYSWAVHEARDDDPEDKVGARLNQKLLKAARAYAAAYEGR